MPLLRPCYFLCVGDFGCEQGSRCCRGGNQHKACDRESLSEYFNASGGAHIPIYVCVHIYVYTYTSTSLYTTYLHVQVTFDMGIEAPVNATIVLDSQIEPMSTCLDSLTLISNGEHIKAFLGRFEQDRNNEHEASYFYNFVGPSTRIHRFSFPLESVPLLEHL